MNELIRELDLKRNELAKTLFEMKQSLDVYKIVSINANEINSLGAGKSFWGLSQIIYEKLFIIDLCKIYEVGGEYQLSSIPSIVEFIKDNNFKPVEFDETENFIKKYSGCDFNKGKYTFILESVLKEFYNVNRKYFDMYKSLRNKYLAHSELKGNDFDNYFFNFDSKEKFLSFGIDFYVMISKSFFPNIVPIDHLSDNRVVTGLSSILSRLGCEDLKLDFDG